jgi:2-hydroxychromene-2-carboxylate isomerase
MLCRIGIPIRSSKDTPWIDRAYESTPTYKSPYAFVANKRLFELEDVHGVELEWLPYTLRIPEFMGTVEERTPHFWRKVRYSYMDARRHANAQGLIMKGPRRIYDASIPAPACCSRSATACSGPITTRYSVASGVMISKSTSCRTFRA